MMYNFACASITIEENRLSLGSQCCPGYQPFQIETDSCPSTLYHKLMGLLSIQQDLQTLPAFLLAKSRRIFGGNLFSSAETLQEQLMTQTPLGFI
jgi:hypothetical protein